MLSKLQKIISKIKPYLVWLSKLTIYYFKHLKTWILSNKKKSFLLFALCSLLFITGRTTYQYIIEPTSPPQNVRITNVSDHSLTISWTTEKPCFGFIFYSSKKYPLAILSRIPFITTLSALYSPFNWPHVATDDHLAFTTTHHATLKNLNPETEYFYRISTGFHLYKKYSTPGVNKETPGVNKVLPDIKTTKSLEAPTFPNPIYGQVVLEKDLKTPIPNALIYLQTSKSNLISTYTNSMGDYVLDLGNLQNKNSSQPINLDLNTEFTVSANAGVFGTGKISVNQKLARPVPRILVKN